MFSTPIRNGLTTPATAVVDDSREVSLCVSAWEQSLQDAVDRTTLSLQLLAQARTQDHSGLTCEFNGAVAVADEGIHNGGNNTKLLKSRLDWLVRQLQKVQASQKESEALVAELREEVLKSNQNAASNKRAVAQLKTQVTGVTERMNRGFVPAANGLPPLEPKQLEMIIETIRPQIEQTATAIAKQECAKSMRKMLSTTVESSNKQLASALGEIAAIKKAVQMLSATTFKNRDEHNQRFSELQSLVDHASQQTKLDTAEMLQSYREEVQGTFNQLARKTNELTDSVNTTRMEDLEDKFANMLERLSNVENSVHHHRAQLRDVLTAHAQVIDGHEQRLTTLSVETNSKCDDLAQALRTNTDQSSRRMDNLAQTLQEQDHILSRTTGVVERKLEQSLYRCTQLCAEQQKRVEALTDTQRHIKQKLKHLEVLAKQMEDAHVLMERLMTTTAAQPRPDAVAAPPTHTQAQAQGHAQDAERITRLERAMLRYSARIDDIFQLTQHIAQTTTTAPPSGNNSLSLPLAESVTDSRQSAAREAVPSADDSADQSDASSQDGDPEMLWRASVLLDEKRAAHRAPFRARADEEYWTENANSTNSSS